MKQNQNGNRGSVLAAALVVALALSLVLAGFLSWVNTESRITQGHVLGTSARLAAETTGAYALAQVQAELRQRPVFTRDHFTSSKSPPGLPPASLLGSSSVVISKLVAQGTAVLLPGSTGGETTTTSPTGIRVAPERIVVSPASAWQTIRIDPANPLYANDPLAGQMATVAEFRIYAKASATSTGTGHKALAWVEERLQVRDVPLFGYVTFYNMDLEIAPADTMDLYGPVHTNGNLYVQTAERLTFHDLVTVSGGIFHGRAPGVNMPEYQDPVYFQGVNGGDVNMKQGSKWVESSLSNWAQWSTQLWGGNVRNSAHGIQPELPAAIPKYVPDNPATPHVNERVNGARIFIEPAVPVASGNYPGEALESQKFAAKSSLEFEVTTSTTSSGWGSSKKLVPAVTVKVYKYVQDPSGTYLHTTTKGTSLSKRVELTVPPNVVKATTYYDYRRAMNIASADFDLSKLRPLIHSDSAASAWTKGSNKFDPLTEWNGIIYVRQTNTTSGAIRTVNAEDVPNRKTTANGQTEGFTLATNGPLYILGNFNADGNLPSNPADIVNPDNSSEPPVALIADAVTILSNAWEDSDSSKGIGNRKASTTEISAAIITGVVPSLKGEYSGGSHNLLRMLERWTGVRLGLRSSQVVLFESEVADEPWAGQSPVYEPPNRVFGFSKLFELGRMPPGTPNARSFRRLGHRELDAAEYQAALTALGES